jgi:hypothetical protein
MKNILLPISFAILVALIVGYFGFTRKVTPVAKAGTATPTNGLVEFTSAANHLKQCNHELAAIGQVTPSEDSERFWIQRYQALNNSRLTAADSVSTILDSLLTHPDQTELASGNRKALGKLKQLRANIGLQRLESTELKNALSLKEAIMEAANARLKREYEDSLRSSFHRLSVIDSELNISKTNMDDSL